VAPEGKDGLEPVTFKDIEVDLPYNGTASKAKVSSQGVTLDVDLSQRKLSGAASCQAWAKVLPEPKMAFFSDPDSFQGNLSFSVQTSPVAAVDLRYDCRAMCDATLITALSKPFEYEVYRADGITMTERTSGPGSEGWVDLESLPIHVPEAVINLEDPSFLRHRGILKASLLLALRKNLDRGSMFVGGSTISQQLAKNLWLSRDRTVTRKAKEALLAVALESCLTKADILELYLNVVEYAPDVYGLGPASKHYFSKRAQELNPDEAYYLASILPRPKTATSPENGGLERTHRLMAKLAEGGRVPKGLVIDSLPLDTSGWDARE
jgi:membrane peptidoglycan carboxypeptidase